MLLVVDSLLGNHGDYEARVHNLHGLYMYYRPVYLPLLLFRSQH